MEMTINFTRVPIPRGTTFHGIPLELGPAPAYSDLDSELVSSSEVCDGLASNSGPPLEQAIHDGYDDRSKTKKIQNKHLVKCNTKAIVSTLNVRTLGPKGRINELAECSK